jgi:hypothetical protein
MRGSLEKWADGGLDGRFQSGAISPSVYQSLTPKVVSNKFLQFLRVGDIAGAVIGLKTHLGR